MDWMLAPFMLPYLGLVGYDAALHPHRRVSNTERYLHVCAGIAVCTFLGFSLLAQDGLAFAGLVLAVPAMLADEIGFHKHIGRHERRIHSCAFIALLGYVGVWAWMR